MKMLSALCISLAVSGCSAVSLQNMSTISLDEIPKEQLDNAVRIKIYTIENEFKHRQVQDFIGKVVSYSCRGNKDELTASKEDAIILLKLDALEKGADAIIDVAVTTGGADAFGTSCLEAIRASGMAVRIKK